MAFLGQTFDPNAVEPAQDFAPIPSGEYPVMIVDSDMKQTKNGAGHYLELTHQVIDGPFKGRLVWARLNLDNPNAQTVQIAQQHLSAICHACGVLGAVTDSTQLHNIPHVIRVEFVQANGTTRQKDSNEVKAWKKLEGSQPAAAASPFKTPQKPAATARPAANAAAPSWAQKPAA